MTFNDITVYKRIKDKYLNLSDFSIDGENEYISLDSESEYIIMFCAFANKKNIKERKPIDICELNFDEIKFLGGYYEGGKKKTQEKIVLKFGEFAPVIIAKEISEYSKGKLLLKDNKAIFKRRFYKDIYKGFEKEIKKVLIS
jgi:hypothetical protein